MSLKFSKKMDILGLFTAFFAVSIFILSNFSEKINIFTVYGMFLPIVGAFVLFLDSITDPEEIVEFMSKFPDYKETTPEEQSNFFFISMCGLIFCGFLSIFLSHEVKNYNFLMVIISCIIGFISWGMMWPFSSLYKRILGAYKRISIEMNSKPQIQKEKGTKKFMNTFGFFLICAGSVMQIISYIKENL